MKKAAAIDLPDQARVLKTPAHESLLSILIRLAKGACTAGALVSMIGGNQSTVSKRLAMLRLAGIVDDKRKGQTVEYRLIIPCVVEFRNCATRVIQKRRNV